MRPSLMANTTASVSHATLYTSDLPSGLRVADRRENTFIDLNTRMLLRAIPADKMMRINATTEIPFSKMEGTFTTAETALFGGYSKFLPALGKTHTDLGTLALGRRLMNPLVTTAAVEDLRIAYADLESPEFAKKLKKIFDQVNAIGTSGKNVLQEALGLFTIKGIEAKEHKLSFRLRARSFIDYIMKTSPALERQCAGVRNLLDSISDLPTPKSTYLAALIDRTKALAEGADANLVRESYYLTRKGLKLRSQTGWTDIGAPYRRG